MGVKEINAILGAQTNIIWAYEDLGPLFEPQSPILRSIAIRGSRNFGQGVQLNLTKKLNVFFFSPQLILQKSNGFFQRKPSFFKVPEGVQHFPGGRGSNFFRGGGGLIAYSL